jgi:peptide/nickel transport system substrate-binding protein
MMSSQEGKSYAMYENNTFLSTTTALLLSLLISTAFTLSCADKTTNQHKKTDALTIGLNQEPDTLWPALGSMMAGSEIKTLLGLNSQTAMTVTDDKWKIRPFLAGYRPQPDAPLQIPRLENGGMENLCEQHPPQKEGERCGLWVEDMQGKQVKAMMVTHWELREKATWSDGVPVSVDDVVFGYHFMMSSDLPIIDRSMEDKIAWIGPAKNADGESSSKRFNIYWKELYAYNQAGGLTILPKHILSDAFVYNPAKIKEHWFGRKPIGWGPWKIQEYRRGSHIILVPNEHFWDYPKMRLKKLTYRFIHNTNSLKAALEAGDIDLTSEIGLNVDDVIKLEKRYPDRWNYFYRPGLVWEHIDLRQDHQEEVHGEQENPLMDVRVRKALIHAANRELLAAALFEGKVKVAHSYLPALHYGYHQDIQQYPFDLQKAGSLLDEAGWKMQKDGYRRKNGQKLYLEFGTTAENKIRELVQQVLQQDWGRIGIDVEVKNEPPPVFFGQTTHKRKFKHMAMYAWLLSPIAAGDTLYRGDKVPNKENNWQGQNYPGLKHEELTKLAILGEKQLDQKTRTQTLKQVQEIFAAELPAIPLYFRVNSSVITKRLKNWRPTGTLIPTTWNSHEWVLED